MLSTCGWEKKPTKNDGIDWRFARPLRIIWIMSLPDLALNLLPGQQQMRIPRQISKQVRILRQNFDGSAEYSIRFEGANGLIAERAEHVRNRVKQVPRATINHVIQGRTPTETVKEPADDRKGQTWTIHPRAS